MIRSDVEMGATDQLLRRKRREFEQKAAKEAKRDQKLGFERDHSLIRL